jgi:hypothetical protein
MTQSYYGEGYDAFGRPNQRAPSTAAYYERPNPYTHSYYDAPHQDLRSEYVGRNGTRTLIQEQGSDQSPAGLQRRRIQVAVRPASRLGYRHFTDTLSVFTLQATQNQMHRRSR